MGTANSCTILGFSEHEIKECRDDPVLKVTADSQVLYEPPEVFPSKANKVITEGKGPGSSKTVFSSTRETLKALKTQEANGVAQARWSQAKNDWKAKVLAEMEDRERNQAPAPEADRYGADERQLALQAIREEQAQEEEERNRSEAHERADAAPAAPVTVSIDQDGASKEERNRSEGQERADAAPTAPVTVSIDQDGASKEEEQRNVDEVELFGQLIAEHAQEPAPVAASQGDERRLEEELDDLIDASLERASGICSSEEAIQRKACMESFIAKHGFEGVNSRRSRTLRPSIYPLHLAAEKGDTTVVLALLEARADVQQKDSLKRLPADVARKHNRKGSHDEVLALLSSS